MTFRTPRFPIAENVTGALVDDAAELAALLRRHVVSPVRWEDCARGLAAAGATTFVEAGVGDVLTKLQKRIDPDVRAIPSTRRRPPPALRLPEPRRRARPVRAGPADEWGSPEAGRPRLRRMSDILPP